MTILARPPRTSWAAAHPTLLALVALSAVLLAAVVVTVTLAVGRPAADPVPRPAAPPAQVDDACTLSSMRVMAIPFC